METKIKSDIKYDDRRKEITQILIQENEVKIKDQVVGKAQTRRTIVYDEKGIRGILKDLEIQKKSFEENIKSLRELQESPEMTPELKDLKEQLVILQKINHAENATKEDSKKEKESLKNSEENLRKVTKDIKDIRDAIGTRLKL